jgi:hypothetical protein
VIEEKTTHIDEVIIGHLNDSLESHVCYFSNKIYQDALFYLCKVEGKGLISVRGEDVAKGLKLQAANALRHVWVGKESPLAALEKELQEELSVSTYFEHDEDADVDDYLAVTKDDKMVTVWHDKEKGYTIKTVEGEDSTDTYKTLEKAKFWILFLLADL